MFFQSFKYKKFFLLTSVIFLLACQEKVEWTYEDSLQSDKHFSKKKKGKEVSIETELNKYTSSYQHIIKWNFKDPHALFFIYTIHSGHKNLIYQSKDLKGEFVFSNLPNSSSFTYRFERFNKDLHLLKSENISVPSPKDYIFEGDVTLKNHLILDRKSGYKRVIFKKGAIIQTLQYSLLIDTESLIVEGDATIENFKTETQAATGKLGRHGGNIKIVAEKAEGNLKILLKGENGGQGKQPQKKPATPSPALSGKFAETAECSLERRAQDGSNGSQGDPGDDGLRGGDTGSLYVQIEHGDHFHLETESQPGLGGPGGPGGPGGLGGKPGKKAYRPSYSSYTRDCHEKTMVTEGALGKSGTPGNSGEPGQESPICIKISGQSTFPCLKENLTWKTN